MRNSSDRKSSIFQGESLRVEQIGTSFSSSVYLTEDQRLERSIYSMQEPGKETEDQDQVLLYIDHECGLQCKIPIELEHYDATERHILVYGRIHGKWQWRFAKDRWDGMGLSDMTEIQLKSKDECNMWMNNKVVVLVNEHAKRAEVIIYCMNCWSHPWRKVKFPFDPSKFSWLINNSNFL